MNLNGKKLILASRSPRRFELMKMASLDFEVKSRDVDEVFPVEMKADEVPLFLARKKAHALMPELKADEIVIGADTVVILNNRIFNKPADHEEAVRMLAELSGQTHTVVTGVCILSLDKEVAFAASTRVAFNTLTADEIEFYVSTFKPFDKAGAYACQEWIGAVGIRCFEGDYFNVVGLPIERVYRELKSF